MRHTVTAMLIGLALLAASPAGAQGSDLVVQLELAQEFYYEGDPLEVQISVRNTGSETRPNPIKTPLLAGFTVRPPQGDDFEPRSDSKAAEPARPETLAPGAFYGTVVDVTEIYPQLRKQGSYQIYWSGSGLISRALLVTIIPRFEPDVAYTAKIDTDFGVIEIDLYGKQSPIAVKSFIDLARVGFYDGLQFHEVRGDAFIVGGNPVFADSPRRSITFPSEFSSVPLVAGTVVLKPASAAPPANDSTFIIMLKPQPAWTGQATVLGQVVQGLDVARKISQAPSSQRSSQPFFKPLDRIVLRRVTITEKGAGDPAAR